MLFRGALVEQPFDLVGLEGVDEKYKNELNEIKKAGEDFRMLVMPDHPTPIRVRTHTSDSVPYLLYDSRQNLGNGLTYCEEDAKKGPFVEKGHTLRTLDNNFAYIRGKYIFLGFCI